MYIVSRPKPQSEGQNQVLAKEAATVYPPAYLRFLQRFGEGTYRGWMNVQFPDAERVEAISLQAREPDDEAMYALVLDEIYRQVITDHLGAARLTERRVMS